MAPIARKADQLLAERDARPLPRGLSPHKLRHTFASLLVALGNDPAYVMQQPGHTDPAFTLRVYAHKMRRDEGGTGPAARAGRGLRRLGTSGDPVPKSPESVPDQAESEAA